MELILIKILVLLSFAFISYKLIERFIRVMSPHREHPQIDASIVTAVLSFFCYEIFMKGI